MLKNFFSWKGPQQCNTIASLMQQILGDNYIYNNGGSRTSSLLLSNKSNNDYRIVTPSSVNSMNVSINNVSSLSTTFFEGSGSSDIGIARYEKLEDGACVFAFEQNGQIKATSFFEKALNDNNEECDIIIQSVIVENSSSYYLIAATDKDDDKMRMPLKARPELRPVATNSDIVSLAPLVFNQYRCKNMYIATAFPQTTESKEFILKGKRYISAPTGSATQVRLVMCLGDAPTE